MLQPFGGGRACAQCPTALSSLRADHLDAMYASIRAGVQRPSPGTATIRRVHATLRPALNSAYRRTTPLNRSSWTPGR